MVPGYSSSIMETDELLLLGQGCTMWYNIAAESPSGHTLRSDGCALTVIFSWWNTCEHLHGHFHSITVSINRT